MDKITALELCWVLKEYLKFSLNYRKQKSHSNRSLRHPLKKENQINHNRKLGF